MTSEVLTFNTTTGLYTAPTSQKTSQDPWHHLPAAEWVQKQVDWANQSEPSGEGLVEPIFQLKGDLVGVEIGVCLGATTESFLKQIPNIKKIYAVDNYPTFIDWNGGDFSAERQQLMKEHASQRLAPFGNKVDFIYESSTEFVDLISVVCENYFDFVFVDGDHSEEQSYKDFTNFYPLVKKGGIFAGHDIVLPGVEKSLKKFLGDKFDKVVVVKNSAWYLIKE